ncbi:MAG: 5-carboxymethyl-2-hydroxymuconate isomerase [Rhodobacteraceae bacterium]|nr:5-carboxymethyl-2-hydroxymuconate isomerase [Paracoccaceae bacterium]
MPHLTIEYSPGLEKRADVAALCQSVHAAMKACGVFPLAGIRVRAFRADVCIVADDLPDNDFAAMTLCVGAGRDTETLQRAGQAIFDAARTVLAGPLSTPHFALSLDIRVNDPALSWKDTPIHARLTAQPEKDAS